MKKKTKFDPFRRCAALLLAVLVCVQLVSPAFAALSPAPTPPDAIHIRTVSDLISLSKSCSLDTWSRGKTVILDADISISGTDFSPIPTFGGTFDGNGHTITGLSITGKFTPAALFSLLQDTAIVRNLTLNGTVEPGGKGVETGGATGGKGVQIGGIAGENSGLIENCVFNGVISGENCVGGIAGVNTAQGRVERCSVNGSISGKSMTGGIVGKNLGTISGCVNHAYVNIASMDPGVDLSNLDISLDHSLLTLRTLDTLNLATDTGGIAGYSSGMLLSCQNTGTVGYPHTGYNVGGIAGRSSGHIYRCCNRAQVYGRKDVGGIAGQAEPYIVLNLSTDMLAQIRSQLDQLSTLVNRAGDDAQDLSSDLSGQFSAIVTSLTGAMDHAETLTDLARDYGDSTITEINRGSDLVKDTVDSLAALDEETRALTDDLSAAFDALHDAMEALANASEYTADITDSLRSALRQLEKANGKLEDGAEELENGLLSLSSALRVEDQGKVDAALADMKKGLEDLLAATEDSRAALEQLAQALKGSSPELDALSAAAQELLDAQAKMTSALQTILRGFGVLQDNLSLDLNRIKQGLESIGDGLDMLSDAPGYLDKASKHLRKALDGIDSASPYLTDSFRDLADGMDALKDASDDMAALFDQVDGILDHLSASDTIQIAHPSEEIGDTADALFRTMDQLNAQLDALNAAADHTASQLTEDLRAISNQFHAAMNTLLDTAEQVERGEEDLLSDTSDENISAVTLGKLLSCENTGSISGDINVGGVTGSMAVEYELDPEDDLLSNDSALYRREYELKVILQKCVSSGAVTSRRSYSGGICGRMELGLIVGCEGYGTITSEQTDYVGGIAGYAAGTVRDSFAKCRLSGRNYVGGITGAADSAAKVRRCVSFVQIDDSQQFFGAVSGSRSGDFLGNVFVSDTLAGLDRFSITGQAEPIEYETLLQREELPDPFRALTLRFLVDGKVVQEQTVPYGESPSAEVFPVLSAREGCFAAWDQTELEQLHFDTDVTAVYTPYQTALSSSLLRPDGRAIFFVEGQFETDRAFTLTQLSSEDVDGLGGVSPLSERTVLEVWRLEDMDDGQPAHILRYLPPSDASSHLELYQNLDGTWTKLEVKTNGSYQLAEVSGAVIELAVVRCTSFWWIWLAAGAAVCVLLICVLVHRKQKGRKSMRNT